MKVATDAEKALCNREIEIVVDKGDDCTKSIVARASLRSHVPPERPR